nr:hypothetical protein [Tanacetum cinerariifolium]
MKPPCKFPFHSEDCPHSYKPSCVSDGPVFVIVIENDQVVSDPIGKLRMGDVVELTSKIPDKSLIEKREEIQRMYESGLSTTSTGRASECCQYNTNTSIPRIPAKPHDELPILSTHDDEESPSHDDVSLDDDDEEEAVFMATIKPARTIGRTNPEFHHLVSK